MYQLSQTWLEKLQVKEIKKQEIFQTNYAFQNELSYEEEISDNRGIIPVIFPAGLLNSLTAQAL